jgi:hypothetical protein
MKSSEPVGLTEVPITREVVLQLLSHIPRDLILVGGQALAFWIEHYGIDATPATEEDVAYVSRDADFLGKREHVKVLAEIIAGKASYPPRKALTILCGQIFVIDDAAGTFMNIDVIHRIGNLDSKAVRTRAVEAAVEGNTFYVMHPLDVLISRVENYRGIKEKQSRNGLRQIELSIEVAKQYVFAAIKRDEGIAIKAIEKVAEIARSPAGIFARKHGAEIYEAIEPRLLQAKIRNENFLTKRLPILIAEIDRYAGQVQR